MSYLNESYRARLKEIQSNPKPVICQEKAWLSNVGHQPRALARRLHAIVRRLLANLER